MNRIQLRTDAQRARVMDWMVALPPDEVIPLMREAMADAAMHGGSPLEYLAGEMVERENAAK